MCEVLLFWDFFVKKIYIIKIIAVISAFVISCDDEIFEIGCDARGSGNFTAETRELYNFNKVTTRLSGDIFIKQDTTESFRIETDDNIHAFVKTWIKNGNLYIDSDKSICPKKLEFNIGMTDINGFSIEGSSDITSLTPIKTNELLFVISGSGDIDFKNVTTDDIGITINGSGDVMITGTAVNSNIVISGSGDIIMGEMPANTVNLVISGSGDVRINVREKLNVTISGSGDVYYKGSPKDVNTNISGSGRLIKVD